ncbi:MAG: hypothetical protein JSS81_07010 [Acidobacteria bacterium]|nr:hypothetical protein [Acidobacteriota bacterium]
MENTLKLNSEELQIQGLLDSYLKRRTAGGSSTAAGSHLDEDTLSAFVEGSLSERETLPVVNHLVDCSFCRHVTTELIRFDLAFADVPVEIAETEKQPAKISEILSGFVARLFGGNESAVFAHQEQEKPEDAEAEKTEDQPEPKE